jgi:hypothetical protein
MTIIKYVLLTAFSGSNTWLCIYDIEGKIVFVSLVSHFNFCLVEINVSLINHIDDDDDGDDDDDDERLGLRTARLISLGSSN